MSLKLVNAQLSGIAGLAITYGLNLNTLLVWTVWSLCNLENKIISVERILQYISIPEEPPLFMSGDKLAHNWPSNGEIHLYNLHVNPSPFLPLCSVLFLFSALVFYKLSLMQIR